MSAANLNNFLVKLSKDDALYKKFMDVSDEMNRADLTDPEKLAILSRNTDQLRKLISPNDFPIFLVPIFLKAGKKA
jgi:hypothetical protein